MPAVLPYEGFFRGPRTTFNGSSFSLFLFHTSSTLGPNTLAEEEEDELLLLLLLLLEPPAAAGPRRRARSS